MTKSHAKSTKPATRRQIGDMLDKVGHRLERNKNLKSELLTRAAKKHGHKIVDECAAVFQKYHDAVGKIIRVDRSAPLVYPDWVGRLHPELEKVGPADFDMSEVEQWLLEAQKTGVVRGQAIYDDLLRNDALKTCFGLYELQAIQAQGIEFFRKHFAGKAVFGYKSTVLDRDGDHHAPCLVVGGGRVVLEWYWLARDWNANNPALRFAS